MAPRPRRSDAGEARTTLARVARWCEENPLGVVRIIRGIRASEGD